MDKIHRQHEFVQKMWKFMKSCEQNPDRDLVFWDWAETEAENLSQEYGNMDFVNDWIVSYLQYVDMEGVIHAKEST